MCAPRSGRPNPCSTSKFPQLLQDMIGDLTSAPEPVVIKLFSQDPGAAARSGRRRSARRIKKIPGVVDVLDGIENTISGPAMRLQRRSGREPRAPDSRRRRWSSMPAPCCRANRPPRRWW